MYASEHKYRFLGPGHRTVPSHALTLSSEVMSSLQPDHGGQPDLCSVTMVFSLRECHMKGIIRYVTLWDELFSLSIIPSHFIQVAACINSLLLSIVRSIPWCVTCHTLLIHSPAEEHLGRFKFLVVMNRVALNILCRLVCHVSLLQGKHPGMGLLGCMKSTLNFKRNCRTICPKRLHHSSLPPAISEF